MTDEQIEATLSVFGTAEEWKRWNDYCYRRDHMDEIVKKKTADLLTMIDMNTINARLDKQ